MAIFTIKIDERNKSAKSFINYIKTLPFVKIEEESQYNPEFVKKIKESEKQIKKGEYQEIDINNVWGSLGL